MKPTSRNDYLTPWRERNHDREVQCLLDALPDLQPETERRREVSPWWIPPIVAGVFTSVILLKLLILWLLTR